MLLYAGNTVKDRRKFGAELLANLLESWDDGGGSVTSGLGGSGLGGGVARVALECDGAREDGKVRGIS